MMNRTLQIASVLLFLLSFPVLLQGQGHLVLIGGGPEVDGGWSDDPYTWGIEHAPNGRVAIVTTDTAPGQSLPDYFMDLGADTARNLIIDDTATANSMSTYDTLMSYDAILLKEGSRWEYIDTYESTLTETAIQQTYQQGGVILGTASGMSVLSGVSFTAENGPLSPKEPLADLYDPQLQLDTTFLPLREGMIFDDRFVQKGRFGRMLGFIGRWYLDKGEELLGIGVDDRTAFCLGASDTGIAMGSGAVSLYSDKSIDLDFTTNDQRLVGVATVTQLIDSCWVLLDSENSWEEVNGFEHSDLPLELKPRMINTFLSGSDIPHENAEMLQGLVQKVPLDTTGPEVDTVAVISANDDLALADSMEARFEGYGDLEASIVQAIPANANDPGMTQAVERADLYFFVNSEYDKLMNTLGQGSLGGSLVEDALNTTFFPGGAEPFPPRAFMGSDARLAGKTFVRHYDSTNASYNHELEFEEGLGIMQGTVILPHCFDTAHDLENSASAVPYAMLKNGLPYGIHIPRESYGYYYRQNLKLKLKGIGPYPLVVWEQPGVLSSDQKHGFAEEPVSSGSPPRQIAGFEHMRVFVALDVGLNTLEGLESRNIEKQLRVKLIQNPVGEKLLYKNPHREELRYRIHDVQGKVLKRGYLKQGRSSLSLKGLESGVHILHFQGKNGRWGAERFVKQ